MRVRSVPVRCGAGAIVVLCVALAAACGRDARVGYRELADEDPEVRADAALRLGQTKAREAVDALVAVLDDPDERVRVEAARALGEIGDPRAVPALTRLAGDRLHTVRIAVAQALGKIGDPAALPALKQLLYDPEQGVRLAATTAVGAVPGDESLDLLLQVALRDDNETLRTHVVRFLGEREARGAIPRLEAALVSEADIVRANAALVLRDLADRSSVPALLRALEDPFFKVRSQAAFALARVAPDDAEVRQALHRRLEREQDQIAIVDLAWCLAKMNDPSRLDLIRELLFRGQPEDVRAEAAIALGEVGDASDVPRLERALRDKKGLVRKEARRALERLRAA